MEPYTYGLNGWQNPALRDFGDYGDMVEYVNQRESGFGDLEGEWYYIDETALTVYGGTFGNDHSSGTSGTTFAEVYPNQDEFSRRVKELESMSEYLDDETADDNIYTEDHGNKHLIRALLTLIAEGQELLVAHDSLALPLPGLRDLVAGDVETNLELLGYFYLSD